MRKSLFFTLPTALFLSLSSCKDYDDVSVPCPECVTVHFGIGFSGLDGTPDTRSLAPGYKYSDGSSINVLKCYVYNKADGANAAPSQVVDVTVKTVNGHPGGDVTLQLPKNQNYDVVFLGTSIPQTTASSKLYYNSTDRTLTVNYASGNDEEYDCFYAVRAGVTTETAFSANVVLNRPFAQLNIGTGDYADYNAVTPVKDIEVSVDGVYSKFSLMDGEVIGSPVKVNFAASAVPPGQTFPVSGYSYLSMNYLLVNHRKLVDVTMTVNHTNSADAANTIDIPKVAVERNYQTNVYGKLLLSGIITD